MKILSIALIIIASFGVVTEIKSDKEVAESIPRYVVIGLFYIWGYLAQRYSEVGYKGGIKSILGSFLFGVGIVGIVDIIFSVETKHLFIEHRLAIIITLVVIFSVAVLLLAYGHKAHRKLVSEENNT